ncbi:MAG: 2,3-bisphosphoglycerate-independent phosphoglycerate mutase, partial [Eubacterium sp.]|nr:2,3-bisphosphoglycerate-independent phosphoglycerate mutase [Eubacterium sp.]
MRKKPTMLMILDGFGLRDKREGNAIALAEKPSLDKIFATYPGTQLEASGLAVGLPEGQMGNSEVGHLNIGAGRVVYQELTHITKTIEDGDFFENPALSACMDHVKERGTALHLLGLVSDGGVHSHITHLLALIDMAARRGLSRVYVHCFLDGRDVPPRCAMSYLEQLEAHMKEVGVGEIATISGRYYAMDRDKRWERVELAYDAMVKREGRIAKTAAEAISLAYDADENDEFVLPTVLCPDGVDPSTGAVKDGDGMILFNFRPDRAREITRTFVDPEFSGFTIDRRPADLSYVCMTQYDASMPNVAVAFPPERIANTLGEYLSSLGLKQLRIAETEKYAHVTFFFNGGVEEPNPGEDRILVPSPKVATYDLQPEMSAYQVTEQVLTAIASDKYDCIILNFANADMVGHTGVYSAIGSAVKVIDDCLNEVVETARAMGYETIITADHGNADHALNADGTPNTAHSTNPVP